MKDTVQLVGLDFGTTTSSAMTATARIRASASGRLEVAEPAIGYRSDPVFTPFDDTAVDLEAVETLVDGWLAESGLETDDVFAGGAIVTGLAAEGANAGALAGLVQTRLGEAVIATADDPALESWLAFMGAASGLSAGLPGRQVLNLDVGGGTTNAAVGVDGAVVATACHLVGARHLRFAPGTRRLCGRSDLGAALLEALGIAREELTAADLAAVVDFQVRALEAIVTGDSGFFAEGLAHRHERLRLRPPGGLEDPVVVFSGGVGELVYDIAAGAPPGDATRFGDLGVALAQRILASEALAGDVASAVPANRGRATVYGMALHSMQVSGATLFLRDPAALPLRDLPVVARLPADAGREPIDEALALARRSGRGAGIQITGAGTALAEVRRLGAALAGGLARVPPPPGVPIVLLLEADVGKVLGNYASDWGRSGVELVVIDEVPVRDAQFLNVGRARDGVVPVSFYGMR
jgi:ethanolamine utilization protein EutA